MVNIEKVKKNWHGKYCVLSLRNGVEHQSPWFHSCEIVNSALQIIKAKGFRAVIYID